VKDIAIEKTTLISVFPADAKSENCLALSHRVLKKKLPIYIFIYTKYMISWFLGGERRNWEEDGGYKQHVNCSYISFSL